MYSVTVNETAPPEYPRPTPGFINVSCTGYTPITYTIEHPQQAGSNLPFEINPVTGEINATTDLDYDSLDEEFHSFNVSCSDTAGNTSTALVEVHVQPVNEFAPQIEDPDLVLTIDETTPNGTLLLSSLPGGLKRIRVEDRDRGRHGVFNFTLLTALDNHFTFDAVHANLTLVREIDFDVESSISTYLYQELLLKIRVCDCTTPANACRIVNFPLFLVASNDNKPSFIMDVYNTAINETASVGSTVLVLECYDADVRVGEISSIAMLNPPPLVQETFSLGNLSSNDSVEVILAERLDYDRLDHFYQFQVSCSDGLHSTTVNVSISVLPENDELPIFTSDHYQFTATQATPPGTTVGQVTAVDSDVDSGQNVSYAILQPTDSVFCIDSVTGEIVVNISLENLSAFSVLVLTVSASDGDLETTVNVSVNITAGNFHSPIFLQKPFLLVMVHDLIEVGAEVVNLTCTDNDTGSAGYIIYSLTPSNDTFAINPETGVVSTIRSLILPPSPDGSNTKEHQLHVQCMDQGLPPGSDTIVVTIQVYRSDVIPPSFTHFTGRTRVSEGAEIGSEVATLTASDEDTDFLSFRIVNQTLPGTFTLEQTESKTSSLRLGASLDYENITVHIVTVEVMELRQVPGEPQGDVAEITVDVLDENDHRPQLVQPLEEVMLHIHDREPEGTVLTDILCHDEDSGSNSELVYILYTSTAEAEEMLNISSSGHLVVAGRLRLPDFVLATNYSVTVSCGDKGDPPLTSLQNATVFVLITKLDVEPPIFYETDATVRISENTSWPTSIYTLAAYDVDSPSIAYNIISDHPTVFTLNSETAQLILTAPLDYETTPTYVITIFAVEQRMDGSHGNTTLTNLTIHVLDINDNVPTFLDFYNESISIPDTTPPNAVVQSVECRDEDEGSNADIVYEILPQHQLFAVDTAGNILVHMPLDLPDFTLQETHNISIQCRDMGVPSLTSTKTITVTVTKTDQEPPVVNISHTSTSLPENSPRGTHVLTLSVFDVDSEAVSLAITKQTIPGTFSLSPLSSPFNHPHYPHLILNGTVDREDTALHHIELLATSELSQNASFSLTVTVQDVNDNAPSCSRAEVTISAGSYNNALLLTLACSDEDEGLNQQLTYGVEGALPLLNDGQFFLNQMSGDLTLDGEIAEGVYLITAVVSDQGTPPLHTSTVIEVEVTGTREGMSLIIIVILGVVTLLLIVGIVIGCGLCCRICVYKRRKKHLVR